MERFVHFRDELVGGHALTPFRFRLQVDHSLEHLRRRGVRGGICPSSLAVDRFHFGEALDQLVLSLQQLGGFCDRHPRQGGRHIKERALIQGRHELRAQAGRRVDRQCQDSYSHSDGGFLPLHHPGDDRSVQPDQEAIHRILGLRHDPPADEQQHQDRHQGDREEGRAGHGEGLGEGERREQPALLRFQGEHRQE
ncbi:hypothetical protein SDC9_133658 [bioreactor metagenome]|uniref:Uncharacterized protein n=1 Tax=bioreactor metagenome TaxID=1076179 RepID=A0A645DBI1_9ZZZZ